MGVGVGHHEDQGGIFKPQLRIKMHLECQLESLENTKSLGRTTFFSGLIQNSESYFSNKGAQIGACIGLKCC